MCGYVIRSKREVARRVQRSYEMFPRLSQRRRQVANTLSGGEQVMLSIAKAVMLEPTMLLLDEPSLGLSETVIDSVYASITGLAGGGLTTLIVEQNVRKALSVTDNVIVLVLGRVRYQGPPDELEAAVDLGRLFVEGKG